MRHTVETLFALQELQFGPGGAEAWARMGQLRLSISADVLARYDRLAAQGKKPVAIVRDGVCGQCHIRVAVGAMFDLTHGAGSGICDSCGRFLYIPPGEMPPRIPAAAQPRRANARSAGRRTA